MDQQHLVEKAKRSTIEHIPQDRRWFSAALLLFITYAVGQIRSWLVSWVIWTNWLNWCTFQDSPLSMLWKSPWNFARTNSHTWQETFENRFDALSTGIKWNFVLGSYSWCELDEKRGLVPLLHGQWDWFPINCDLSFWVGHIATLTGYHKHWIELKIRRKINLIIWHKILIRRGSLFRIYILQDWCW